MASTTTLNTWLEELTLSFLPLTTSKASTRIRRHKDNFSRTVKHHNYGRTNPFAVNERLIGLEEKLQVLNLDDVAGELFLRRTELDRDHSDLRWLPDILDLLLHLSHKPAIYSRLENLGRSKAPAQTTLQLTWEDIQADDPIDRRDPIWSVPKYSDFSSDEDEELVVSSAQTSPASVKQNEKVDVGRIFDVPLPGNSSSAFEAAQFWLTSGQYIPITEIQAVREVLFMLEGHSTSLFTSLNDGYKAKARYRIGHLEATTSRSLLGEAAHLGSEVQAVRDWLRLDRRSNVLQLIQSKVTDLLANFDMAVAKEHAAILQKHSRTRVISLLQILQRARSASRPVLAVSTVTYQVKSDDAIAVLNALYSRIETAQASCNTSDTGTLLIIFQSALHLYSKPVDRWLHTGKIKATEPFFIRDNDKQSRTPSTLWQAWYSLTDEQDTLVPSFLRQSAGQIFKIGKTSAFLSQLGHVVSSDIEGQGIAAAASEAARLTARSMLPFSATFEMVLDRHLTTLLTESTNTLKHILETNCGLNRLLDAFDYIYLAKDGVILDLIETKMFGQIDRCMDMWNDCLLLSDLLAEAYQDTNCVNAHCTIVNAAFTSSRNMESRRRSVKILSTMSISYRISWPLANIIPPSSITSYQRVALTLSQIRRVKYLLKRRAYFYIQHMPMDLDGKKARLIHWQLFLFINVLYANLTNCVLQPFTTSMREKLGATSTDSLDDMIAIHAQYVTALEHATLSSKRIRPLRDALISILDLGVHFTDILISAATNAELNTQSDNFDEGAFEASSLISGRNRRRRRRDDDDSSSDDDDDDDEGSGEGHSAFVLDKDASVSQEMLKIQDDFKKHGKFLIAGLRAVARSAASNAGQAQQSTGFEVGQSLELLADSLDGVFPSSRGI